MKKTNMHSMQKIYGGELPCIWVGFAMAGSLGLYAILNPDRVVDCYNGAR
jgi:hypothetical protein